MTVTRAQIIILISIALIGSGLYLTSKSKGLLADDKNKKYGKILTWTGAAILAITAVMAYKVVPR